MAKNNRGYSINFVTNTITMTQKFELAAANINSDEYNILRQLRKDFPKMTIVERAPKKANKKVLVSYEQMEKYIEILPNSAQLMAQFEEVKKLAKTQNSPAAFTKKWFFATFPSFFEIPTLDKNAKIVYFIREAEGRKIMEEAKAAAGE